MNEKPQTSSHSRHHAMWRTFAAMIAASIVTMFALKYSNVYEAGHIYFSQTRMWMALMMGMAMTVIMLGFMWGMYRSTRVKVLVMIGAVAGFGVFLYLTRSQQTVGDEAWAKAMIPHHSIAILTSQRAQLSDPRMRALADDIIEAQVLEIAAMELILADIDRAGEMGDGRPIAPRSAELTPAMLRDAEESARRVADGQQR